MDEIWTDCRDCDLYSVSSKGRIRNEYTGRILKHGYDTKGDDQVSLYWNQRSHTKKVKRLVAEAFYGNLSKGKDITHYDGDRHNNSLENLEIAPHSEIVKRQYENGRKQWHRMRAIRCIETGKEYESIVEASRDTGISKHTINDIVNGKYKTSKCGLHFEAI